MPSHAHRRTGTAAEWFTDAAFAVLLFSAAAVIATVVMLMIVL
jgi:hypothetical protein